MTSHDNERAPNAQEKISGEDVSRRLLGFFPHKALAAKGNKPELLKELAAGPCCSDMVAQTCDDHAF